MANRAPLQILRSGGPAEEDSYIVKLRQGVDKQAHVDHISSHFARLAGLSDVTHPHWSSDCFHGYAGKFSHASLDALLQHEDVEYVEENVITSECAIETQTNAPWGLARISHVEKLVGNTSSLTYSYTYDTTAGKGVDIYVLDTGIYTEHHDFEGRATWGTTFVGTPNVDKKGHGTHCAGIAAGKTYGIAKAANLIAVKTLGDDGKGNGTGTMDGINWVMKKVAETGRPSVVSNSTGSSYSRAKNDAVDSLTAAGIHFVTAAGNDNTDAKHYSPASAATALTVGSTNIDDSRRASSNYGPCVDVFAPGGEIVSCGIKGDESKGIKKEDSTATKSGTSMACPHVSGLVAYFIAKNGNVKPAEMIQVVKDISLKDVLTNIPSGTANRLAHNDDHFLDDGTYTISPVKKDTDLVRVPKPATDKEQQRAQDEKDKKPQALYVAPIDPKSTEVDLYDQWEIKRIYPSTDDLKTAKPHWTPYYTIQNVGTKQYAWIQDRPVSGEAVVENTAARIWEIDPIGLDPGTSRVQYLIKFTTADGKDYYWGLTDSKDPKSLGDGRVKVFDKYSPDRHWYIIKVDPTVKKSQNKPPTGTSY